MIRNQLRARSGRWRTGLAALVSAGVLLAGLATASAASAASNFVQLFGGYQGFIYGYGSLCVDDAGNSSANENPIVLRDCQGTNEQYMNVYSSLDLGAPSNAVVITFAETRLLPIPSKCLDVKDRGTTNGTRVQLYDCNNTPAQDWVPRPGGALWNPNSGKCLDDPAFATDGDTQLEIWGCNGQANQNFLGS